jgi:hypothetical protein
MESLTLMRHTSMSTGEIEMTTEQIIQRGQQHPDRQRRSEVWVLPSVTKSKKLGTFFGVV